MLWWCSQQNNAVNSECELRLKDHLCSCVYKDYTVYTRTCVNCRIMSVLKVKFLFLLFWYTVSSGDNIENVFFLPLFFKSI